MNKIFYDDDARSRVLAGAKIIYDAVKVTYGPKGRNVVIDRKFSDPIITHDGVTVAESIQFKEDTATLGYGTGIKLIKQAARNLNKIAGDGTSSVTILAYHIMKEANKLISAGHNPQDICKGIELATQDVLINIEALSEKIEDNSSRLADVATISCADRELGELIASVVSQVGKDGIVTVEEGSGFNMTSELVEGYTFDRGYLSPLFITDGDTQEAILEDVNIITIKKSTNNIQDVLPIIRELVSDNKNMLFIVDEIDDAVLNFFATNKRQGALNVCVVKAPSFADNRQNMMDDINILIGNKHLGEDYKPDERIHVGSASKVIVNKSQTTIINANGSKKSIQGRIKFIQSQEKIEKISTEKDKLKHRIASLNGKIAVIKVGGASEFEIGQKKHRIDDAICASKAALSDGIIAGGGAAFIDLSDSLEIKGTDSISIGMKVFKDALLQPFLQVMENSNLNGEVLLDKIRQYEYGYGINIYTPENGIVDMIKDGVIDPTLVIKEVISNASSIAATAMTMGCIMVDVIEDRRDYDQA